MPDVKRRYQVLYRNKPAWVVGEQDVDAAKRRVLLTDVTQSEELYPGSFRGKVISVRPEGHLWTVGDLACPTRSVVTLELTNEEASALRSKELKLDETGQTLLPVSFEDRYGATAANLKRVFPDATVTTEDDERAEIDAVVEADQLQQIAYEDALQAWKEDAAKAIVALIMFDEPKPIVPIPSPVHEPVFAMEAERLQRKLPRTIVHSGAGLYEVGSGKPYSTIQSALDQLWTDQGSTPFTASQYIRIFAGTYDENVVTNAGLNPVEYMGTQFIIEGDPLDDRGNVDVAPAGGAEGIYITCSSALVRHLTVTKATVAYAIRGGTGCLHLQVVDVAASISGGASAVHTIFGYRFLTVIDCSLTATSTNAASFVLRAQLQGMWVEGCVLDKINGSGYCLSAEDALNLIETVCCNALGAVGQVTKNVYALRVIRNCTFYNCTNGVLVGGLHSSIPYMEVINCIFKDVDYPYLVQEAWPEETVTSCGASLRQRNNCYHNYTAYAKQTGGATKTAAEWTAMNRTDVAGELDATNPLLTDPGAGDFSLTEPSSPCLAPAGHGSGAIKGYNGVAFDDPPDIGGWSSGIATPVVGRKSDMLLEEV